MLLLLLPCDMALSWLPPLARWYHLCAGLNELGRSRGQQMASVSDTGASSLNADRSYLNRLCEGSSALSRELYDPSAQKFCISV